MSAPTTHESNRPKALRPAGVSFASLWAGLAAGLVPLVSLLFFYFGSDGGSMTVPRFMFFLVLRVSIVVFALGTWRGSWLARYALIGLVLFSYGWDAYWRYIRAVSSAEPPGISVASWARVVSSVAIGGAIVGYLLFSKRAHEYFRIRHENAA